jgi:diketogulonate reductase-like aldo/keto reductase
MKDCGSRAAAAPIAVTAARRSRFKECLMPAPVRPDRRAALGRRAFNRGAAGAALAVGALPRFLSAAEAGGKRSAVDRVALGATKVRITRLGIGTGSQGGKVQRDLGEEAFTKLVRHAWDRGIRYVDTADNYKMHGLVKKAIQGLPREELVLLTKMKWEPIPDVAKELDRFRQELGVDYFDVVLIHCVQKESWAADLEKMRDGLSAAKEKGIVRAVGSSAHGLPGLRGAAACPWIDVQLARVNHKGHHMDGATGQWAEASDAPAAWTEIRKIRAAGKGVLGMKLVGNGDFTDADDREKAVQAVVKSGCVDAMTIGFKSPAEVDEAIERIDRALNG